MKYNELMLECARTVQDRNDKYGSPLDTMRATAGLASLMLRKPISAYDCAMILHAVKMARLGSSISNPEHYLDGINYLGFAAELATEQPPPSPKPREDFDPANMPAILRGQRPAAPGPNGGAHEPVAGRIG